MAWTTFAALTAPTLPELDGNFSILTLLANIPVTISGTNTLVLTSTGGATAIAAYQQNMVIVGVAVATNNGAVTAQLGGLAALNVYNDTLSGPALLVGGEIVNNCRVTLIYDSALNSGAGGFHLGTGGSAQLVGATINPVALQVNSSPAILGLPSAQYTINFTAIGPNAGQNQTVTLAGVKAGDMPLLQAPATTSIGLVIQAFIPSAGTVVLHASNITAATTITPASATYRITAMRYS